MHNIMTARISRSIAGVYVCTSLKSTIASESLEDMFKVTRANQLNMRMLR